MASEADQFIIHRLRSKPVEYSVTIRHFVSGGEWMVGVTVHDIAEDAPGTKRNALSVACDLRCAANILEGGDTIQSGELESLCEKIEDAVLADNRDDALLAVEAIRVLNAPCP